MIEAYLELTMSESTKSCIQIQAEKGIQYDRQNTHAHYELCHPSPSSLIIVINPSLYSVKPP